MMARHGDSISMANCMNKMMSDNLVIEKYKKKSLLRVEDFSWDKVVDSYEKTYLELMKSR